MLYTLLWRPEACFSTLFNKFTAKITGGEFCNSELVFQLTKKEWTSILSSYSNGKIGQRAESLSKRLKEIFDKADDEHNISLCFYTIWSSEMNLRLLSPTDSYIFNRLPDKRYTSTIESKFNYEEQRAALGFCLSELHKKYDNVKAVLFWMPRCNRQTNALPTKYFCSEFIVYCLQQVGYAKHCRPENITPNDLPKILNEVNETLDKRVR